MLTQFPKCSPQIADAGSVEGEPSNGGSSHRSEPDDLGPINPPAEVVAPAIPPRMKEPPRLARAGIGSRSGRKLVVVASLAGISQVLQVIQPSRHARDNVFNGETVRGILLGTATILAPEPGSLGDHPGTPSSDARIKHAADRGPLVRPSRPPAPPRALWQAQAGSATDARAPLQPHRTAGTTRDARQVSAPRLSDGE